MNILKYGITDQIYVVRPISDGQFVFEFLNDTVTKIAGFTDKVIGMEVREVFPGEQAGNLVKKYQEVLDTKRAVIFRDGYDLDGTTFYYESTLTPLFDDSNVIYLIVGVVKNVTAEQQAELELKEIWTELNKSKKRYQSLFRDNPEAIISFDLNGTILNCNPETKKLLGYTPVELKGREIMSVLDDDSFDELKRMVNGAFYRKMKLHRLTVRHKNGNLVPVSVKVSPIMINKQVEGIYTIFQDLSEQLESERRLYESEERFRVIAENANDLITLLNHQGKIVYASPSYRRIVGFDEQEYVNKIFLYHIHPDDREDFNQIVTSSIQERKPFTIETRHFTNSGTYIWLESKGTPVFNENHQFKHMVVLSRDITVQKDYHEKLKYDAMHDHLTGLPNRRLFQVHLAEALNSNADLGLLMLDIDDFKSVNDTYGHDIGDAVIVEFGHRIQSLLTNKDIIARLGGDEFIILVADKSLHGLEQLAEQIKAHMEHGWHQIAENLKVTTSIGIAMKQKRYESSFALMKKADLALYATKKGGKDGYHIYSKER
ncbi:PAS domain S-box protein [Gracilibacillus oryzae]|uniref:PAS domain S-box protein n=1 Tax=Gracilibacillus oryzae TaxID=1672701 RepID=UPI001885C401|nr:PAS domain S-box protein [Gracilibacillus oryzae]